MTIRADILSRFSGEGNELPIYLPDLTLWYVWHHQRDTFPSKWKGMSLPQIALAIGAPAFSVIRPWRVETPGVEVTTTEEKGRGSSDPRRRRAR